MSSRESPYEERLAMLGWSSLQSRRSYLSLLECYKTILGLNGLNCNDYFEFNCHGKTRSNYSFKLRQPLARVNCFFFCTHSLLELLDSGTLFLERECTNRTSAFFEVNLESIVKFCKCFFSHFLVILKFYIVVYLFYIFTRKRPR